ncbi:unnamed protein product [Anisakis simplex]|uniref:SCP domain-containing protein n=1 Tax=Anisakis simplex TaxID=6269 RepID=A0A3P6NDG4_ANISI|nr:unnamed protein product [Anisakis simplex]
MVGCGYAQCRDVLGVEGRGHRHVFVCHYNPQGNTVFVTGSGQFFSVPAFKWAVDDEKRCSECPPEASACYKGLCYAPSAAEDDSRNELLKMKQWKIEKSVDSKMIEKNWRRL